MRAAIFDVDGTLLDSMGAWSTSGERYLKSLGYKPEENIGKKFFSMTMDMVADYIIENYGLEKDRELIKIEINEGMAQFYKNEVVMKDGVREYLDRLKKDGVKMVIATSTDRQLIEIALRRLNMEHYFMKIFTCTEIGKSKSHPDIFMAAKETLKEDEEHIYVFEDGLYSIETAKSLGFRIAGVYDEVSINDQEKIKELSDVYIEDFNNMV